MTTPLTLSSVPDAVPYAQYIATAGQTVFPYPFPITEDADLVVVVDGVTYSTDIGYTLSGQGNATGGYVTFTSALAGGSIVTVFRDVVIERVTQIAQNSGFSSVAFNAEFNNIYLIMQQLKESLNFCLQIPNSNNPAPVTTLTPGTYRNAYLGFDAFGNPQAVALTSLGALTRTILGGLLYPQTGAENAVTIADISLPYGNVNRYGTNTTPGTTDMSAAFTAACSLPYKVLVPAGTYAINSVSVTGDNVCIQGDGWDSILTVNATESTLFTVTGQNFQISNMQWQGDGTSSSSANGVGVYLSQAGGAKVVDIFWTGMGFGGVSGAAASALLGPQIVRCKARLTGTGGNEVYLGGVWVDTLVEDPNFYSTAADRCLLMFDNSTTGWIGVIVRGGSSTGYLKQQWATTDEHWDGSNRVWAAEFEGIRCASSNWSAIKAKTSRGVRIQSCIFDNCGVQQEDSVSGLWGDVLCNSLGHVLISNNQFRNSGSAAIRINAPGVFQYPGSNPNGQATSLYQIDHNQIDGTGILYPATGDAIIMSNGFKNAIVDSNTIRNCGGRFINCTGTTTTPFWDLGIFNNSFTDSPNGSTIGVNVPFGQSLRADGNLMQNFRQTGWVISDVQEVRIGGRDSVLDAAVTGGYGYQIGNVIDLDFRARCGNSTYPLWLALTPYGIGDRVYNGTHVYEAVVAGTSGNTGGPTGTAAGVTEGTVTWAYVGEFQLLSYGIRLVGTQVKAVLDFDARGVVTSPVANIVMGTAGIYIKYKTAIQTTDATATNAKLVPIPDLSAWRVMAKILAQDATTPNRAFFDAVGLFYRNGGNTTLEGAVQSVTVASGGAGAWVAVPAASTTNIAPARVTGAAGKTINWAIDVEMIGMP